MHGQYLQLLKSDKEDRKYEPPVSTLTFFRGKPPIDLIRKRVDDILAANAWLGGEYRKDPETGEFPMLWIPEKASIDEHFDVVDNPAIRPDMPIKELQKLIRPYVVNGGKAGRAKPPNPLYKVTIITISNERFCLVVSLCHTQGDGHTYYSLYSMLAGTSGIQSLEPRRVRIYQHQLDVVGVKRVKWFKSFTTLIPLIARMLFNNNRPIYRYINMDWVAQQKKLYQPTDDVPYISSNDILTALFMDHLGMDCGLMAVDARGRLPEVTENLAGTYELPVILLRTEGFTPELVRRTLLHRPSEGWVTPGRIKSMCMNIGVVTSWASWSVEMSFEGCEHEVHMPVFSLPMIATVAVIWRPQNDRMGILLNGKSELLKRLDAHPAVGSSIF